MYLPFIRARRFDLLAVRDIIHLITATPNILPIIEPVNHSLNDLINFCLDFKENKKAFILIINPGIGKADSSDIEKYIINNDDVLSTYDNYIIAYQITHKTTLSGISNFMRKYGDKNVAFIHYHEFIKIDDLKNLFHGKRNVKYHIYIDDNVNRNYKNNFSGKKIIIRDCLNRRNNADYPYEEFFSDLPNNYSNDGYNGFGDFLIQSLRYSEGFRPYAVAIHLTYKNDNNIWINHFVSDTNETQEDTAGKFLEALNKLVIENRRNANKFNPYSSAINE